MSFDRFDICCAWYLYAITYHGGQGSKLYEVFGRLARVGFKPGDALRDENSLTANGREIYENLVARELYQ